MKKLLTSFVALIMLAGVSVAVLDASVLAVDPGSGIQDGVKAAGGGSGGKADLTDGIKSVVNVLLYILGVIAVIMIIIGGIRYTVSNGDSNQINAAKNTILYSIVGLVVALLAYAIVNFVITAF